MKLPTLSLAILFLCIIASVQAQSPPRFESYPAFGHFSGKPAPAIISHPRARLFRTTILNQAKGEPNFAGYYHVATWGCGSGCEGLAVIDARTGRVYFNPLALNVATVPYQNEERLQFHLDSRLLIISGAVDGSNGYQAEAKFYFEWGNNRFRLIRKTEIERYNP